jgi:hypothetical protein
MTSIDPREAIQQETSSHCHPENVRVLPEAMTPWIAPDAPPERETPLTVIDPREAIQQETSSHCHPENVRVLPDATTPSRYPIAGTEPETLTGSSVQGVLSKQVAVHEPIVS